MPKMCHPLTKTDKKTWYIQFKKQKQEKVNLKRRPTDIWQQRKYMPNPTVKKPRIISTKRDIPVLKVADASMERNNKASQTRVELDTLRRLFDLPSGRWAAGCSCFPLPSTLPKAF